MRNVEAEPMTAAGARDPGYTGLATAKPTLPARWYYDSRQYEVELERIWYRQWLYAGLSRQVREPGGYQLFELGSQSVLLVRGEDGVLRAFHNTCRHRGANLCREANGAFSSGAIVCPYHAWRYDLHGRLVRTTSKLPADDFEPGQHDLYPVAVREWNGCIFVCFAAVPPPFGETFDQPLSRLDPWRMADLALAHAQTQVIACNWKTFWENYNECLHCPGVHPMLSQLVPIFGRGLQERRDDPRWLAQADSEEPRYSGRLRQGAASWTLDGGLAGHPIPGLSADERAAGQTYVTCLPSAFIVGHVDYVRIVRLRPLGPEQTELTAQFLFMPESLADPQCDINKAISFTSHVLQEDAAACELNQRGLQALPHKHGTLMPEEYLLAQFHDWVRAQL